MVAIQQNKRTQRTYNTLGSLAPLAKCRHTPWTEPGERRILCYKSVYGKNEVNIPLIKINNRIQGLEPVLCNLKTYVEYTL
jgi:hypothetical protein